MKTLIALMLLSGSVFAVDAPNQDLPPVYRAQLLGYLYQQACETAWGGEYVAGGPSSNFYQLWACEGGNICNAHPEFFGCNRPVQN